MSYVRSAQTMSLGPKQRQTSKHWVKPRQRRYRKGGSRAGEEAAVEKAAAEMAKGVELERKYGSEAYWSGEYKKLIGSVEVDDG